MLAYDNEALDKVKTLYVGLTVGVCFDKFRWNYISKLLGLGC